MSFSRTHSQLPSKMNAICATRYGAPENVLQYKQLPLPQLKPDNVLVKISAAGVHAGDWRLVRASPFIIRFMYGFFKPGSGIPGCDMCGVVQAVGDNVSSVKVGETVFGDVSDSGFGAFAEYVSVPSDAVVVKPDNVSVEDAAVSGVSALAALHAVKKCDVTGKKVLVNGASGGVGTFCVQMAKHFGASETWAVCNGAKAAVLTSLGATHVIDYTKDDVVECGQEFDVVIDNACYDSPSMYESIISKGGKLVVVGGTLARFVEAGLGSGRMKKSKNIDVQVLQSGPNQEDLKEIAQLLSTGAVKPYIDREFSLKDAVEALKYVEDRKVTGKVLLKMSASD